MGEASAVPLVCFGGDLVNAVFSSRSRAGNHSPVRSPQPVRSILIARKPPLGDLSLGTFTSYSLSCPLLST